MDFEQRRVVVEMPQQMMVARWAKFPARKMCASFWWPSLYTIMPCALDVHNAQNHVGLEKCSQAVAQGRGCPRCISLFPVAAAANGSVFMHYAHMKINKYDKEGKD